MAWIAEPLTFYGLLATGLILCLVLFVSVKKENTQLRQVLEKDRLLTVGKMEEFRSSMLRLQAALQQAQSEAQAYFGSHSTENADVHSVNVGKRSLALRMHRRGETPEQIAATLHIPRNELELLLKVHQAVIEQTVFDQH
jgi:hypothetical protein